jgi:hypothetical protein
MQMEEIIILDEGLELTPVGTDSFCCTLAYVPYMS